MKSAGKARNNGLYRHIRTSKEIIRNLLNDYKEEYKKTLLIVGLSKLFHYKKTQEINKKSIPCVLIFLT